jgi:hypothetical protein
MRPTDVMHDIDNDNEVIMPKDTEYKQVIEFDEPLDEEDYSAISTQELVDILENDGQDHEEDRNPEIPLEQGVEIEGVETEGVETERVETEGAQENNMEEGGEIQVGIVEDYQSAMDEWSDQEGDILDRKDSEDNDEVQSRIHYTTRSGQNVQLRKDLVDNYELMQVEEIKEVDNKSKTPTCTQWSLKQGMKLFPHETKEATMAELLQLQWRYFSQ